MNLTNYLLKKVFKIEDGRVKLFNKVDYLMFPAPAMAEFIQKIGEDFGEDYLFELGYEAGEDGANELMEKLSLFKKPLFTNLKIIKKMFEILGYGEMDIKFIRKNKTLMNLRKHPVVEAGKIKFGRNSTVCTLYRGIFSIHGEKELKIKGCKLIETQCVRYGNPFCEWSYNVFENAKNKKH